MRLAISLLVLGFASTVASAQPQTSPSAAAPTATAGSLKVGDTLPLTGAADWPKLKWSYNVPNANDAAGKVVIHWFCSPKVSTCIDDLARIVTLREAGSVYVVAYINGSQREAKKLDPIRESEGVGRGTVAWGPNVKKLFKQLGIAKGPASIVVGVDGKVKVIATSGDINELDSRDSIVKAAVDAIKPYTITNEGPTTAKPNDPLRFAIKIQLASWLSFSAKTPMEFALTASKDVKCDATRFGREKMKIEGRTLTAQVTCTAPKGSYQVRGDIRFGYETPDRTTGLGNDFASWKFEVKPQ
jgi:hypothetical protein